MIPQEINGLAKRDIEEALAKGFAKRSPFRKVVEVFSNGKSFKNGLLAAGFLFAGVVVFDAAREGQQPLPYIEARVTNTQTDKAIITGIKQSAQAIWENTLQKYLNS